MKTHTILWFFFWACILCLFMAWQDQIKKDIRDINKSISVDMSLSTPSLIVEVSK